jgi:hypothetical protein
MTVSGVEEEIMMGPCMDEFKEDKPALWCRLVSESGEDACPQSGRYPARSAQQSPPSGNVTVKQSFRHVFGMKLDARKVPVGAIRKLQE